jgi:hypothetical protein
LAEPSEVKLPNTLRVKVVAIETKQITSSLVFCNRGIDAWTSKQMIRFAAFDDEMEEFNHRNRRRRD